MVELEAGRATWTVPWWVRFCRLAERWGLAPWSIVKGTPDDRHWSRAAWIVAQSILDDADAEVQDRRRTEKR